MNLGPTNLPGQNIPVLTEVISLDDGNSTLVPAASADNTIVPGLAGINETEREQLEREICENVLRQLLTRVDFVLEHRVRDSLADVLQTAVDGLAHDIRQGLSNSLEEVIRRTVNQELSRLQAAGTEPPKTP